MTSAPRTIFFLGATGGCALSTLRRALAAGHMCVCLCRTPATLSSLLAGAVNKPCPTSTPYSPPANLEIIQGSAHDPVAVSKCLVRDGRLVDFVVFSIGNRPTLSGMLNMDKTVCQRGMEVLLQCVTSAESSTTARGKATRVIAVSSTGISDYYRDVPLVLVPVYKITLAIPHRDKKAMEDLLVANWEGENGKGVPVVWTVVRPSLLTDGPEFGEGLEGIRVGVEVLGREGRVESKAVGYTISREDVGRWIYEELVMEGDSGPGGSKWAGKAVTLTY